MSKEEKCDNSPDCFKVRYASEAADMVFLMDECHLEPYLQLRESETGPSIA